jgi:hypothetical protein
VMLLDNGTFYTADYMREPHAAALPQARAALKSFCPLKSPETMMIEPEPQSTQTQTPAPVADPTPPSA